MVRMESEGGWQKRIVKVVAVGDRRRWIMKLEEEVERGR